MTSRGFGIQEMKEVAQLVSLVFKNPKNLKNKEYVAGCAGNDVKNFLYMRAYRSLTL